MTYVINNVTLLWFDIYTTITNKDSSATDLTTVLNWCQIGSISEDLFNLN